MRCTGVNESDGVDEIVSGIFPSSGKLDAPVRVKETGKLR